MFKFTISDPICNIDFLPSDDDIMFYYQRILENRIEIVFPKHMPLLFKVKGTNRLGFSKIKNIKYSHCIDNKMTMFPIVNGQEIFISVETIKIADDDFTITNLVKYKKGDLLPFFFNSTTYPSMFNKQSLQTLILNLAQIIEENGIGIALPQVGIFMNGFHLHHNLFNDMVSNTQSNIPYDLSQHKCLTLFYNNVFDAFAPLSGGGFSSKESCLSIKDEKGEYIQTSVFRYFNYNLSGMLSIYEPETDNLTFHHYMIEQRFDDDEKHKLFAAVLQHEYDHLKCTLITDKGGFS